MNLALAPAAGTVTPNGLGEVARTLSWAGISFLAAVLCSALAMVYMPASWLRAPVEAPDTSAAAQPPAETAMLALVAGPGASARTRTSCSTCGMVDHVRRIDNGEGVPATFEISIRMRDGSTRSSTHASADSWRSGDRIVFIGGRSPL